MDRGPATRSRRSRGSTRLPLERRSVTATAAAHLPSRVGRAGPSCQGSYGSDAPAPFGAR